MAYKFQQKPTLQFTICFEWLYFNDQVCALLHQISQNR